MNTPNDLRYTEEHEWVRLEGDVGTVGITDHAQEALGDIVFVELPEVGRTVNRGDEACAIESSKAASDIYAPVGGTVVEVNQAAAENPALVNEDPYGKGWIYKIRLANPKELDGLMDAKAYAAKVAEEE
jgi:glycine cleavage system H protein